eukprot:g5448.t1
MRSLPSTKSTEDFLKRYSASNLSQQAAADVIDVLEANASDVIALDGTSPTFLRRANNLQQEQRQVFRDTFREKLEDYGNIKEVEQRKAETRTGVDEPNELSYWKTLKTADGRTYYSNSLLRKTQWESPFPSCSEKEKREKGFDNVSSVRTGREIAAQRMRNYLEKRDTLGRSEKNNISERQKLGSSYARMRKKLEIAKAYRDEMDSDYKNIQYGVMKQAFINDAVSQSPTLELMKERAALKSRNLAMKVKLKSSRYDSLGNNRREEKQDIIVREAKNDTLLDTSKFKKEFEVTHRTKTYQIQHVKEDKYAARVRKARAKKVTKASADKPIAVLRVSQNGGTESHDVVAEDRVAARVRLAKTTRKKY